MYRRDIALYLTDIEESIAAIEEFTDGVSYEFFAADRKTYSATLREFIVIGEAIAHLPGDVKGRVPSIEWRQIKDFRNFIIHEYFGIDSRIVWDAVRYELPELKREIVRLHQTL